MKNFNRRSWLKASMTASAGLFSLGYANASGHQPEELTILRPNKRKDSYARLSSNENPFGPANSAKKAIKAAIDDGFLYPRHYREELMEAISKKEGVNKDHILLGAGSTELLQAGARVFGGEKAKVLSADPTYTSLVRMAQSGGAEWLRVPLTKNMDHQLDMMESKISDDLSLLYMVNPNNPTGKILTGEEIKSFCNLVAERVPVFVDEAYLDYMDDPANSTATDCIKNGKNVIVARTFSKVHAFAGLRVGYCVAQPEVIKEMASVGPRNSLAGPSMAGAAASLLDKSFIEYSVKKNNEGKAFIYSVLDKLGYDYFPSHTNFILFPIQMDGDTFRNKMMEKQVSIKTWEIEGQQYCRVSMGLSDDLERFADAFKVVTATKLNKG